MVFQYLKLLDAAMLLKPLERFSGNRIRQKISSPKLVLLNNALVNASFPQRFNEIKENDSRWGRLVENTVGAALVNNNAGKAVEIFYWRDRDHEIDFVLRQGEKVLGIEVKTGGRQTSKGRGPFLRKFPAHEVIMTCVGGGDIPAEALVSMSAEEIFQAVNR